MTETVDAPYLLKVGDLSKTFGRSAGLFGKPREVRAVNRVSFELMRGETLGLVGETGSGKSTLGRLVLRLVEPTGGSIEFDGQDITALRQGEVRNLRREIQMVFQDSLGSLDPRMTIGQLICEPMIVHGYPRSQIKPKALETMQRVGLNPVLAQRYPHQLSGGQRQRVGIARALVLDPQLLVLDEPVSALDVSIQAQILNLLRDIQKKTGISYLFIAHDLAVVQHISHRVAVMYLGRIVELTDRRRLYAEPQHPYTAALLSAVPVPEPELEESRQRIPLIGEIGSATNIPSGCAFHPRCFRARQVAAESGGATFELHGQRLPERCASDEPLLVDDGHGHATACHFKGSFTQTVQPNRAS